MHKQKIPTVVSTLRILVSYLLFLSIILEKQEKYDMQNSLHVQSHHLPFFTFIIMSVETEMNWIWAQIKCCAGNQMTKTYPFSWKSFDYIITCSEEDAIVET